MHESVRLRAVLAYMLQIQPSQLLVVGHLFKSEPDRPERFEDYVWATRICYVIESSAKIHMIGLTR